jgi:hypothetical protein
VADADADTVDDVDMESPDPLRCRMRDDSCCD